METFQNKSIIISRKSAKDEEGKKSTLQIALFSENNPHLSGREPFKVLEYKKIEKVRIRDLRNVSFYTSGNDLVINDLNRLEIKLEKGTITLTGEQEL